MPTMFPGMMSDGDWEASVPRVEERHETVAIKRLALQELRLESCKSCPELQCVIIIGCSYHIAKEALHWPRHRPSGWHVPQVVTHHRVLCAERATLSFACVYVHLGQWSYGTSDVHAQRGRQGVFGRAVQFSCVRLYSAQSPRKATDTEPLHHYSAQTCCISVSLL